MSYFLFFCFIVLFYKYDVIRNVKEDNFYKLFWNFIVMYISNFLLNRELLMNK